MTTKRITMQKIKDVLRLKHAGGLSLRQIERSLNLSIGVISKYLSQAKEQGISWPLPEGMSDKQLMAKLQPGRQPSIDSDTMMPDFVQIQKELSHKGMTRQLLWEEYAQDNPQAHYSYSRFTVLYRQWRGTQKLSMRQIHIAGEKLFVDYCGPTMGVVDPNTGELRQAQIFVSVLGAGSYTYADATWSQRLPDWIGSHIRAFEFYGGVPQIVVPDNLLCGAPHNRLS